MIRVIQILKIKNDRFHKKENLHSFQKLLSKQKKKKKIAKYLNHKLNNRILVCDYILL